VLIGVPSIRRFGVCAAIAGLIAVVGAAAPAFPEQPAAAQTQPPAQPGQRPVFRTEANLVRVDVHVLKNGGPVPDLDEDDFEVLEDGVRQKIESLEFVRVEAPQSRVPVQPSSTAAAQELASDPRNRVFILFLDTYHVTEESSLQTPMALVRMIDSLIGPTDLIGLMTPEMEIRDLILSRKTDVLRNGLLQTARWGRMLENCRVRGELDYVEKMYTACYPCIPPACDSRCDLSPTALHMIRRRREAFTLGVLSDLVRYIGSTREARTAFILVTEGWTLFRESTALGNVGAATPPQIRIGPGGRLGTQNPGNYNVDQDLCARHLRETAQVDHYRRFMDLMDDANRNNASFYIVDAGGLRTGMPSINAQPGQMSARGNVEVLQTLAENTDGRAIVNTNDIKGGLLRVVDDLSGYYLIGYYSTNTKSDGSYRSIKVKVNRPGVEVRSRKGYRAWTANDIKAMNAARATVASAPVDPAAAAHATALSRLARLKPDTQLFVHASIDAVKSELYVIGELSSVAAKSAAWREGGDAQILVNGPDGSPAGSGRATIVPGGRAFLARLPLSGKATGAYEVAVRLRAAGGAALFETIQAARTADGLGEPIAFRSAPRQDAQNPVATFMWWRTEPIRFEAPLSADAPAPSGRVLDRAGNPMPVPVDVTLREEGASRWAVATFKLAPLSPGDYILELISGATRRFVALRVDR
jgi:VWFA-related protein